MVLDTEPPLLGKSSILLLTFRVVIGGFVAGYLPMTILASHPGRGAGWSAPAAVVGVCAVISGAIFYLACAWDFAASGGFAPATIVRRGTYRAVRNPMYAALVLVLLGESALFGSWRLVGYAVGVWLVFHVIVLYEERGLAQAFGPDYDHYRDEVPRWIPWARWSR